MYYGIANRAFDIAVETAKSRVSPALSGRTYAHHPQTQVEIAKASIELDSIWAFLSRVARNEPRRGSRATLANKLLGAKQHAVDGALRIVDRASKVAGASSLLRRNELERLTRDVRSGPFHPPNSDATHDLIGQIHLGVFPPAAQAAE